MQNHQLLRMERQLRVGTTPVVGEFDLVNIDPKMLDNGPDLASNETPICEVGRQGDDIEKIDLAHYPVPFRDLPKDKARDKPQCSLSSPHDPAGAKRRGTRRGGDIDIQNEALPVLVIAGCDQIPMSRPGTLDEHIAQRFRIVCGEAET